MKFAAVFRSYLLEQPAIAAAPADIGTWVRVLAYASERESDTVTDFCTDREWMTAAGVTMAEVAAARKAGLLTEVDGGLLVGGFDYDGLRTVQARRAAGPLGAKFGVLGGRPKSETPQGGAIEPPFPLPSSPSLPHPGIPKVPSRGQKSYHHDFERLWAAVSAIGRLGNTIKGEASVAWLGVGGSSLDIETVADRWRQYLASLPDYQTTPKHFGRWLKARGHEQTYQPFKAPPSASQGPSATCGWHSNKWNQGKRAPSTSMATCADCRHWEAANRARESLPESSEQMIKRLGLG